MQSGVESSYQIERRDLDAGRVELRFAGRLLTAEAAGLWDRLRALLAPPARAVLFNLGAVESIDGASSALLIQLRADLGGRGIPVELVGARGDVATILELYDDKLCRLCTRPPPGRISTLEQVGDFVADLSGQALGILRYVGDVTASALGALRRPASINWRDIGKLMERTGADALPIISMIAFLIGLVTAFQASGTLKQYGANIYVADLVGLSILREMGPLMTAILVTGRSGAGFAAEIGTMKVSEEIDALRALGIDPIRFLVIPRILALVLMVPLLVLLADVVGVLGGMIVGIGVLDLTVTGFMTQLQESLGLWDLVTGLIKSVFFAATVGLIACERGLATRGGAEGVGRSTTSAVVTILFHLVIITSALTILFQVWDI